MWRPQIWEPPPLISKEPRMAQRRQRGANQQRVPPFLCSEAQGRGQGFLGVKSGSEGQQKCPEWPTALGIALADRQLAGGVTHLE